MVKAELDALEDCLERLNAGASIDRILALYPQWAEDLRPLLESAHRARSLRTTSAIPTGAMARSRVRFLEKSINPKRQGIFRMKLHFSHSLMASISAILILAIGTSFVSAQSIPGDILYPVKIAGEQTRLLLTTNSTQRLILQESYDQTRTDEVEGVIQAHRMVKVTFDGMLSQTAPDQWQVAGVKVSFLPDLNSTFVQMSNAYVEVTGLTQKDGSVQVSQVRQQELDFSGTVTHIGPDSWLVDQVVLHISSNTIINGIPTVGASVSVKAYRLEDASLVVSQVDVINSGNQEVREQVSPSLTVSRETATTIIVGGPIESSAPTESSQPNLEKDGLTRAVEKTPTLELPSPQPVQANSTSEFSKTLTNTPEVSTMTPTVTRTVTPNSEQSTGSQASPTTTQTLSEQDQVKQTPSPTAQNHGEGHESSNP